MSVRKPYAWAILKGIKKIENRGLTFPDYRGPILLHSGKIPEKIKGRFPDGTPIPDPESLSRGAILGAAIIVAKWPLEHLELYGAGKMKIKLGGMYTVIETPRGTMSLPRDPHFETHIKTMCNNPFATGPECILIDCPLEFEKPFLYSGQVGLFHVDERKLDLTSGDCRLLHRLQERAREIVGEDEGRS